MPVCLLFSFNFNFMLLSIWFSLFGSVNSNVMQCNAMQFNSIFNFILCCCIPHSDCPSFWSLTSWALWEIKCSPKGRDRALEGDRDEMKKIDGRYRSVKHSYMHTPPRSHVYASIHDRSRIHQSKYRSRSYARRL